MFDRLRADINAVKQQDPAARSSLEILLLYSGIHAIIAHRFSHFFYRHKLFFLARLNSQLSRFFTGIEIHPGAKIGKGVMIDHGCGVVIGETAEVGDGCAIYQGVTLGGTGKDKGKRHPTLGKNVMVGAGAKVLGPFKIGDNAKIAAGAVVLEEVPANCTAVGVPARVVRRKGVRPPVQELDQVRIPDPVAQELCRLQLTIERLEMRLKQVEAENISRAERKSIERYDRHKAHRKERKTMKIFNTLTRKKEEFIPLTPGKVKMYACGPTVYNYIHIGNARPICVFDTLRRYLEYRGYEVTFVQNFTDVDDKLIKKANEEGITVKEVAERYIKEYITDAEGLGIRPATFHPRATENMDKIIEIVKTLVDKGYAYEANGDVYFRTKKFDEYGKLSHMPLEELESGARIAVGEQKEDAMDFALWKAAKAGEPAWDSPWGKGRPGWHIECTAMINNLLGDTIDIHCGGQDLIFPHHENEIAQSECCTGKEYARYWMHNGYINVDNRKMSKSLNNFFTVRDVAEKYGYEPIKFMMLQAHYRSPINYSVEVIEQCKAALERLYNCRDNLDFMLKNAAEETRDGDADRKAALAKRRDQFVTAMDDDLNTADGIAAVFDLVKDINTALAEPQSRDYIRYAAGLFDELTNVLGLVYNRKKESLDSEIEALIEKRQQARKNKDFKTADAIRDELKAKGIILEDTPQGVKWSRA